MDDIQFGEAVGDVSSAFDCANGLPEGDLLREIILGLVPSLCAVDFTSDPEIRRKTFWWLADELKKYAAKSREQAVMLELRERKIKE
jgi:hypothetical protein